MAHSSQSHDCNVSNASAADGDIGADRRHAVHGCAICLDSTSNSPVVLLSPCHHSFCRPCIEQWVLHLATAFPSSFTSSAASMPGGNSIRRHLSSAIVAPTSATCPLCKSHFTDGVTLTPASMSYGVPLPAAKWRLPVSVSVNPDAFSFHPRRPSSSSAEAQVGSDADRARLAGSTNPLDDPIWSKFPLGYRSKLAECRRHLMYHAWWRDGCRPTVPTSMDASVVQPGPVRRRHQHLRATGTQAKAAVMTWIERDIRAVYHAILLGAPQVLVHGGSVHQQGKTFTSYDSVLVQVATDLIVSLTCTPAAARQGQEDENKLRRLVQVLQLPSIEVAEKLVVEAAQFAESGLGMDAFDAMANNQAGVPTLVEMAKRDYEQGVNVSD